MGELVFAGKSQVVVLRKCETAPDCRSGGGGRGQGGGGRGRAKQSRQSVSQSVSLILQELACQRPRLLHLLTFVMLGMLSRVYGAGGEKDRCIYLCGLFT